MLGTEEETLANDNTSQRQTVWGCPQSPDDRQLHCTSKVKGTIFNGGL